jgi:hypothetical protein
MMQVGPDDAILNLCKWPRKLNQALPENCLPGVVTISGLHLAATVLVCVGLLWFGWPYLKDGPRQRRMIAGIFILCCGVGIGIFGLSIIAAGDRPLPTTEPDSAPVPLQATLSPLPSARPQAQYGALHAWQQKLLADAIPQYSKIVIARPQMVEPQTFARIFENVFKTIGIETIVTQQNTNARNQTGVRIGVIEIEKPPSAEAVRMQNIIRGMGFGGEFIQLRDDSLVAAKENHEFAIFVGPAPLP